MRCPQGEAEAGRCQRSPTAQAGSIAKNGQGQRGHKRLWPYTAGVQRWPTTSLSTSSAISTAVHPGAVQTHDFSVEPSRDTFLPERVRRDARFLLRHYSSRSNMLWAGRIEEHADTPPIGAFGPVFSSTLAR